MLVDSVWDKISGTDYFQFLKSSTGAKNVNVSALSGFFWALESLWDWLIVVLALEHLTFWQF